MNPPRTIAIGQRWTWKRRDGAVATFEVTSVLRFESGEERAYLRNISTGDCRWVDRRRLRERYTFEGDYSIPPGFRIVECDNPRGHYFVDPFGHVEGPPPGQTWTWKQARDAAAEYARASSRRLPGPLC